MNPILCFFPRGKGTGFIMHWNLEIVLSNEENVKTIFYLVR
jgi:hypothetical protein